LLEGRTVNLRVVETADLPTVQRWDNDLRFIDYPGELDQTSLAALTQRYEQTLRAGGNWFLIETKRGAKVGYVAHYLARKQHEIGYAVIPEERGKGYATGAAMLIVDYLFLTKNIVRVQADANVDNRASQRVLEKAGFTREGVLRHVYFEQGAWRDAVLYSILRDEWHAPRVLQAT
jgi:RimJ/RimL family protein N-acetyltransferase